MRYVFPFAVLALLAIQSPSIGATPRRIQVKVIDESGKPVSGAIVDARYLEVVTQDGRDYPVPMELAVSEETDSNGFCELRLKDVTWSLAGLRAIRPELTLEEAEDLLDNAPQDRTKHAAYEKDVYSRMKRFQIGFILLDPTTVSDGSQLTLKLTRAERVMGRVRLDGKPLVKADVHFFSRSNPIDKLFSRTAPELTDADGRIDYYSAPGELDRGRVVIESEQGKRVLSLTDIDWTRTAGGRKFDLDTHSKDYELVPALNKK